MSNRLIEIQLYKNRLIEMRKMLINLKNNSNDKDKIDSLETVQKKRKMGK